ncbi:MAG: MarR family transcriptional regulator [Gemmatimonadales bacterium]
MAISTYKAQLAAGREARNDMVTIVDAIRSIVHTLRISARESEQRLGISSAQLYVLQELRDRPALSINELAERTYTHQSSVSMVVARLVENRLVKRVASPGDARRLSISLTAAGRTLLRRSPAAAQTRLIKALRSMSRADLRALAGDLAALTDILEVQAPESERKTTGKARLSLRA